jgi:hypothetical protein
MSGTGPQLWIGIEPGTKVQIYDFLQLWEKIEEDHDRVKIHLDPE